MKVVHKDLQHQFGNWLTTRGWTLDTQTMDWINMYTLKFATTAGLYNEWCKDRCKYISRLKKAEKNKCDRQ
jgi:hypothetical protein